MAGTATRPAGSSTSGTTSGAVKALQDLAENGKTPQGRLHALYAPRQSEEARREGGGPALARPGAAGPRARRAPVRVCGSGNSSRRHLCSSGTCAATRTRTSASSSPTRCGTGSARRTRTRTSRRVRPPSTCSSPSRTSADPWMRLAHPGRDRRAEHAGRWSAQLADSQYFRGQPDGPAFLIGCAEVVAADSSGTGGQTLFNTISTWPTASRYVRADPTLARALLRIARPAGRSRRRLTSTTPITRRTCKAVRDAAPRRRGPDRPRRAQAGTRPAWRPSATCRSCRSARRARSWPRR